MGSRVDCTTSASTTNRGLVMNLLSILLLLCGQEQIPDEDPIAEMRRISNYGVDLSKIERGERYFFNGAQVSKGTATQKVSGVPDDSTHLRVTIIGTEEQRKIVLNDIKINPEFEILRDHIVVQDYAPDHWAVQGVGFHTAGTPTIYVQLPNGKVVHRQDDYSDGAVGLAGALRKADPNYRRDGDPDLRRTLLSTSLLFGGFMICFALLVIFRRDKDEF
jgi:hypothetical protein